MRRSRSRRSSTALAPRCSRASSSSWTAPSATCSSRRPPSCSVCGCTRWPPPLKWRRASAGGGSCCVRAIRSPSLTPRCRRGCGGCSGGWASAYVDNGRRVASAHSPSSTTRQRQVQAQGGPKPRTASASWADELWPARRHTGLVFHNRHQLGILRHLPVVHRGMEPAVRCGRALLVTPYTLL